MELYELSSKLVTGVSFTNGEMKSEVGILAVNCDGEGCEAVGFHFYESLDKLIPVADKQRIGKAS